MTRQKGVDCPSPSPSRGDLEGTSEGSPDEEHPAVSLSIPRGNGNGGAAKDAERAEGTVKKKKKKKQKDNNRRESMRRETDLETRQRGSEAARESVHRTHSHTEPARERGVHERRDKQYTRTAILLWHAGTKVAMAIILRVIYKYILKC